MAKAIKKGKGTIPDKLRDQDGHLVPIKYIPEHDLRRHMMVTDIITKANKVSTVIRAFKDYVVSETNAFVEEMMKEGGIEPDKFRGNVTLYNFEKSSKIEVNNHDFISFSEKIGVARELIDECLNEWTKGTKKELRLIVSKAFKTDKRGLLDTKRILDLLSYEIEDPRWQKAMEVIKESISINKRKQYYSFRTKNEQDEWTRIILDFAGIKSIVK
ncbi:MAG: DUF3164 family protein [Thiohalomonadaceae bacterium]